MKIKKNKTIKKNIVKKEINPVKKSVNKVKKTESSIFDGSTSKTKIRVIGIGGGGGSIISEICGDLPKIDFIAANTDKRSLQNLSKKVKVFQFGESQTKGLGTGMDPELGKNAAFNEKEKIKKIMENQDICILVASLGAGTGSGATPVFAKIAKELGCIVYGIFTLPFNFEGSRKLEIAKNSLEETRPYLNALSILPNENIFKIIDKNAPLKEALSIINNNLSESLKGLIEAIYNPGLINIDFADLRTVLEGKGKITYLNTSIFDVSKGVDEVLKEITASPFYSYNTDGATGILLNVTGSRKIGLNDVSLISGKISETAKKNASIIFGISHDDKYGNKIKITVLAVGCESDDLLSKLKEKETIQDKKKIESKKTKKIKNKKIEKDKKLPEQNEKELKKKDEVKDVVLDDSLEKISVRTRRNALEIKKINEDAEKEILEDEKKWETPAFLRRSQNDK
jgi:cell division protein FtsZ